MDTHIKKTHLLLVEDDELLGDGVRCGLAYYNYAVDWVKNGEKAWEFLQTEHYDMVILDLGLPNLSGLDILENMRANGIVIPVIIVSGYGSVHDRIKGLNVGADDYVSKPFKLEELCARIRAIQRRKTASVESIIVIGNIVLDITTRRVIKSGKKIKLSRREFVLLQMLMESVGSLLSRKRILQRLYCWGDDIKSNALEVHIHSLRKKLGRNTIITHCREGYAFVKNANEGDGPGGSTHKPNRQKL